MNRNENEAESFAGNFVVCGEYGPFFEVPLEQGEGEKVPLTANGYFPGLPYLAVKSGMVRTHSILEIRLQSRPTILSRKLSNVNAAAPGGGGPAGGRVGGG